MKKHFDNAVLITAKLDAVLNAEGELHMQDADARLFALHQIAEELVGELTGELECLMDETDSKLYTANDVN